MLMFFSVKGVQSPFAKMFGDEDEDEEGDRIWGVTRRCMEGWKISIGICISAWVVLLFSDGVCGVWGVPFADTHRWKLLALFGWMLCVGEGR